ncbi:glycine betaine ABC transporter substrate-binding protein [Paenirhodobacter sp.]|uniref:glycine betaine ABC transporter substrate-binding protein n=1 Tax=Paenirhodobacter sp. TaxID=1965326 RepID=UPI003B3E21B2
MQRLLATTVLAAGFFSGACSVNAQDCGTITLALHNVQSAELLTYVDKIILEKGYGCSVETIPGDTVPSTTSMIEKGTPDVSSETWVDLLPEIVPQGLKDGKIVYGASALPDGGIQGWWIPKYIAEAHPEIKTVEDALAHPELFPDPEDPSKGVIFNGSEGWGATVVTAQLFKAYDAEQKGFNLMRPGSAAGLDGAIARAYERKVGFITYYWAPTALLGRYEMVLLEPNAAQDSVEWQRCITNLDCPDPKVTAWPVDTVMTVVTKDFSNRVDPAIMKYFNTRGWRNTTVASLIAWQGDNQAMGEDTAIHFLKENKDIWKEWLPADIAEKVESGL